MIPNAVSDHTPDLEPVPFENVPGRVLRVFRHQDHLPVTDDHALAGGFAVHGGDDDVARPSIDQSVDHQQVTGVDAGSLHAFAVHLDQVNAGCTQVEQLVYRHLLVVGFDG